MNRLLEGLMGSWIEFRISRVDGRAEGIDVNYFHWHLHLLVVEAASAKAPARIRGVISKTQIQHQLGLPLDGTEIGTTFTGLSQALG